MYSNVFMYLLCIFLLFFHLSLNELKPNAPMRFFIPNRISFSVQSFFSINFDKTINIFFKNFCRFLLFFLTKECYFLCFHGLCQ